MRFAEPSRHDHNHDDVIGTVHLTKYLYPGPLPHAPSVYLGGGDPDFRDAKITVSVRGVDWKPNGSELLWWTQSQKNIEVLNNAGWIRPNWAYTGFPLTDFLRDGWRNGKDHTWRSAENPSGPQEFIWSFERPVTLTTVQLHQDPDWPAKEVEVLATEDGKTFTRVVHRTLPEKAEHGPNFALTV